MFFNVFYSHIDVFYNYGHYRYMYVTLLREPTARYLSEWKHVQRGSTWQSAQLVCDGRPATLDEVPFCFQGLYLRLSPLYGRPLL